jgi:hypothetical protein
VTDPSKARVGHLGDSPDGYPTLGETPHSKQASTSAIAVMSDHGGMCIPWWAWRLWPGKRTVVALGPTGEPPPPDGPRRYSEQHARLLTQLQSEASADWSSTALTACLEQLRTSNVTEAGQMAILDAWVDGPDAFCVVYQSPYEAGEVGIRRTVDDAASSHNQKYRPGDTPRVPTRLRLAGTWRTLTSASQGRPDPCDMTKTLEPVGGGRWVTRSPGTMRPDIAGILNVLR